MSYIKDCVMIKKLYVVEISYILDYYYKYVEKNFIFSFYIYIIQNYYKN